jgi:glycosyltransferase involved in cell wall biosynthesis
MKLLSIVWFKVLPARFGGQKGTALFNHFLAEGAPLVCLCAQSNAPDGPLNYRLRPELPDGKKSVLQPSVWKKILRVATEERPTHILLEFPYHAWAAVQACRSSAARLVVHEHNIEYKRFRELKKWWWPLLRRYERWALQQADLLLFKTEADARTAQEECGISAGKCMIVPYGIDPRPDESPETNVRKDLGIPVGVPLLLFAGTLDYAPNAAAVEAIYKNLAPAIDEAELDYRIVICGRNRDPKFRYLRHLEHPRVINAGEVESIALYYKAADLFINPVLSGAGMQTKNIDALACHRTVVAFTFAAQGIDRARTGNKLLVVQDGDWTAFVRAIKNAMTLQEPTPDAFFEYYSWPRITARVLERLKQLS